MSRLVLLLCSISSVRADAGDMALKSTQEFIQQPERSLLQRTAPSPGSMREPKRPGNHLPDMREPYEFDVTLDQIKCAGKLQDAAEELKLFSQLKNCTTFFYKHLYREMQPKANVPYEIQLSLSQSNLETLTRSIKSTTTGIHICDAYKVLEDSLESVRRKPPPREDLDFTMRQLILSCSCSFLTGVLLLLSWQIYSGPGFRIAPSFSYSALGKLLFCVAFLGGIGTRYHDKWNQRQARHEAEVFSRSPSSCHETDATWLGYIKNIFTDNADCRNYLIALRALPLPDPLEIFLETCVEIITIPLGTIYIKMKPLAEFISWIPFIGPKIGGFVAIIMSFVLMAMVLAFLILFARGGRIRLPFWTALEFHGSVSHPEPQYQRAEDRTAGAPPPPLLGAATCEAVTFSIPANATPRRSVQYQILVTQRETEEGGGGDAPSVEVDESLFNANISAIAPVNNMSSDLSANKLLSSASHRADPRRREKRLRIAERQNSSLGISGLETFESIRRTSSESSLVSPEAVKNRSHSEQ